MDLTDIDMGWPSTTPEFQRLVHGARENADLLTNDLYTIRDWMQISGYQQETLAVLLLVQILGEGEGSLCTELSRENLCRRLRDLVTDPEAERWAGDILADLDDHGYPALIGVTADDDRPLVTYSVGDRRYLYFQKILRYESEFAKSLAMRLVSSPALIAPARAAAIIGDVLKKPVGHLSEGALELDGDQKRALELALTRGLAIISGGPGTGKTSIVFTLLRSLVRAGVPAERIALAAPTGRAAQRLGDTIRRRLDSLAAEADSVDAALAGLVPNTLHKLLEYLPTHDRCRRHAENPLEADVVIVDEVSMVGMVMMARLLEALPASAQLVLLGDKDQLPSVEAGAVLSHLLQEGGASDAREQSSHPKAVVLLRTNHRCEPGLCAVADAINQQNVDVVEQIPRLELPVDSPDSQVWQEAARSGGCRLLELTRKTPLEIRQVFQHWASVVYLSDDFARLVARCVVTSDEKQGETEELALLGELFERFERARLLTLVRDGPWGCVEANHHLEQLVRPRLDRRSGQGLFAGAPVLVTRNAASLQLYNGDVGLTLRSRNGGLRVVFQRHGGFLQLPVEALPAHELGFALTVHKSQGSEYDQVLVVLPPEGGRRLLTKELLYTAVTRAKKSAILCATTESLRLAIARKCAREAGILRGI